MKHADYIPLEQCRHGYLYQIHCRNLSLGIFNKNTNGFIGIRTKFGDRYLFTEYHYDTGAPFGTVHPHKELELYSANPEEIWESKSDDKTYRENKAMFAWLDERLKQYEQEN